MIIPDINLLVYAYNSASPYHGVAKKWLEETFTGLGSVGLPWAVIFGFVRLLSNAKVVQQPDRPEALIDVAKLWMSLPSVRIVSPGMRHLQIVGDLFRESGCSGKMTTDIHLAALAIEMDATLYSNDLDFGRFGNLSWSNPLKTD